MGTVWYSARRDARGRGHVTRHERRRDQVNARPFTSKMGGRWGYEWATSSLGTMALAIDLLSDAQGHPPVNSSPAWFLFEQEVIEKLPATGWILTREAIWDWYLSGLTIYSLNRVQFDDDKTEVR